MSRQCPIGDGDGGGRLYPVRHRVQCADADAMTHCIVDSVGSE